MSATWSPATPGPVDIQTISDFPMGDKTAMADFAHKKIHHQVFGRCVVKRAERSKPIWNTIRTPCRKQHEKT